MSTTRPCPAGDRGPDPGAEGAPGAPGEAASRRAAGAAPAVPAEACGSRDIGRVEASAARVAGPPPAAAPGPAGSGPAGGAQGVDDAGRLARRISLRGASGVVPLARDFTRQALCAWGWMPAATADQRAATEDVLLVVSELVTNACLHAEGPDELWIGSDRKVLRVEVTDRGSGQPAPRTPHRAGRPGGHGMFIVQRLCLDWGVQRTPGVSGKTVWAELGAPS